jgi:hypothetical protein
LPGRVFSGRRHPRPGTRAVFFCYTLPAADRTASLASGEVEWTEAAGLTAWYLYDLETGNILHDGPEIADHIRSQPDTPRHCELERPRLVEIRKTIEKQIKNSYLKSVNAPDDVKPRLKCWMELN